MGDFSDFQRSQIVDAHLAGTSVTKPAILLGVSRAPVSRVMTTYTNHERTSTKGSSGQKPKQSERDRCTLKGDCVYKSQKYKGDSRTSYSS